MEPENSEALFCLFWHKNVYNWGTSVTWGSFSINSFATCLEEALNFSEDDYLLKKSQILNFILRWYFFILYFWISNLNIFQESFNFLLKYSDEQKLKPLKSTWASYKEHLISMRLSQGTISDPCLFLKKSSVQSSPSVFCNSGKYLPESTNNKLFEKHADTTRHALLNQWTMCDTVRRQFSLKVRLQLKRIGNKCAWELK